MFPVKIASRVLYYIVPIDNFSLHRQKVYGYLIIPFPLDGLWPDQSGSEMLDPCLLVGRKRRSFCFQDAADDIVKISLFILRLEFPISCVLSLIESKKNLVFQLKAVWSEILFAVCWNILAKDVVAICKSKRGFWGKYTIADCKTRMTIYYIPWREWPCTLDLSYIDNTASMFHVGGRDAAGIMYNDKTRYVSRGLSLGAIGRELRFYRRKHEIPCVRAWEMKNPRTVSLHIFF